MAKEFSNKPGEMGHQPFQDIARQLPPPLGRDVLPGPVRGVRRTVTPRIVRDVVRASSDQPGNKPGQAEERGTPPPERGRSEPTARTFGYSERRQIRPVSEEESRRIIRHLQEHQGIIRMDNPAIGAIHGTSLEAIEQLVTYGVLPGKPTAELHYRAGDIAVVPTAQLGSIVEQMHSAAADDLRRDPDRLLEDAIDYAETIAHNHAILRVLGIPLDNRGDYSDELTELQGGDPLPFEHRGVSSERLLQARQLARQRRGFLIGIDAASINTTEFPIIPGDLNAADLAVGTMGRGLPSRLIRLIQPLGASEQAFLDTLRA